MSQLGPSQLFSALRSAERRLSSRDPDATDFEDVLAEAERLRSEYSAGHAGDMSMIERDQRLVVEPEDSIFG